MPSDHTELLNRLVRQLGVLQSDKYAAELGETLRSQMIQRVPMATGNMATKLLRMGGPRRFGNEFSMWIGDKRALGNDSRAPRNTIRDFLRDHPEFRRKRKRGRFTARQAWWILPPKAKQLLQQERMAGKYGGAYQGYASNKAAYFYQQEGSDPEWANSAKEAGISPTHFVANSIENWMASDVPRIVARFVSDVERA
jgi:hypothetical protein